MVMHAKRRLVVSVVLLGCLVALYCTALSVVEPVGCQAAKAFFGTEPCSLSGARMHLFESGRGFVRPQWLFTYDTEDGTGVRRVYVSMFGILLEER